MKSLSPKTLAYLLAVSPLAVDITQARYAVTSKLTSIENIGQLETSDVATIGDTGNDHNVTDDKKEEQQQSPNVIKNLLSGKILTRGSKLTFENKQQILEHNIDNPCYIYFSEDSDVDVKFAYFYDSYPLQVTPQHIFFWPGMGKNNFTAELDTNIELDNSNTAVYCGDLSDILGEKAIESERAQSIRLGSFPQSPTATHHQGYFKLVKPVKDGCTVQLHFPPNKAPSKFKFSTEENDHLNHIISIDKLHNDRSIIMSGFDDISSFEEDRIEKERKQNKNFNELTDTSALENRNIYFDLEYETVENIAPSYHIIAQVMCMNENGHEIDQSEYIESQLLEMEIQESQKGKKHQK